MYGSTNKKSSVGDVEDQEGCTKILKNTYENCSGAQWEIQQYAKAVSEILQAIWPNSWNALKKSM